MVCRTEETNPPQASVLHMGTQYLLYRTDNRFTVRVCFVGELYLGLIQSFLYDGSFLFFPKSTATHRNHMKCVCAFFILVLGKYIIMYSKK